MWQEYTKELYNKGLNDWNNHNGVVTHLVQNILECEVKWALGSTPTNKASEVDGITAELFKILKDDAVKVLHSVCQQIWKTLQWPHDWKISVSIPIPKKGNVKECLNYHTIALISHASKFMLKIFQAKLQQHMNQEFSDVQSGFRKCRATRNQFANICWIMKKATEFQKISVSASMTTLKPLTVRIKTNHRVFLKKWELLTLPVSRETSTWVMK